MAVLQLCCAGLLAGLQRHDARSGEVEFLGMDIRSTAESG